MSNPDVELRKLIRRADRFAARLNPGLAAIAIVLSTCLLAESAVRFPAFYTAELAADTTLQIIDPTAPSMTDAVPPE